MDEQTNSGQAPRPNKSLFIIIAIVILIALGWFFFGSGKSALNRAGIDTDYNKDGSTTYTNEDGSVTIGGNKLPDNWPSDAPAYPKASIQYSGTNNPQTGAEGSAVVFLTEDSLQTVVDFYKKELTSNGWKIENTATIGGATVLAALKDTRTLGVYISDIGNGQVSVTVGIEIK